MSYTSNRFTYFHILDSLCPPLQPNTIDDGQQYVTLTEVGRHRYRQCAEFLRNSGFLRRRADLATRSQFSQLEEYDDMIRTLGNIVDMREEVLRKSEITSGMRVLELGCGTGEMTLTSGLYKIVGPEGEVMATDPSGGMLARARGKLKSYREANVRFVEAAAEELPFEDNSFDAVVGCGFLHFTDIPQALREVHRVSKPGTVFTTVYPLEFPGTSKFFLEWFAPVLVMNSPDVPKHMLPTEDTVPNAIRDMQYDNVSIQPYEGISYYQHPEIVVKFMVQVGNFFDAAMELLPWKARQDMIELLIRRGHDAIQKYGVEQLVQIHPGQFLQARIVK